MYPVPHMIRYGEKNSSDVAHVQEAFNVALNAGLKVDGWYGKQTENVKTSWARQRQIASRPRRLGSREIARLFAEAWPDGCEEPRAETPERLAQFGAFLWQATKLTVEETVSLVQELGLSRVYPKVMNKSGKPMYAKTLQVLIPALQAAGITVIPWAYLDDKNGAADAEKLADLALGYGCDGAIANMEREVVDGDTGAEKRADAEQIDQVLTVLCDRLPGFVGLSSFRRRDYFPFPRDVFEKHRARVTFMPQCYNLKAQDQAATRVQKSADSWLAWGLSVRMTLGAFPPKASSSKTFGSQPEGMIAGAVAVGELAKTRPLLDPGFDWWALEQVRDGYASQEYRDALKVAHAGG